MTICGFQETDDHPVKNKATRLNKGFYEVLYKNNCSVLLSSFSGNLFCWFPKKSCSYRLKPQATQFPGIPEFSNKFHFHSIYLLFSKALIQRIDCFKKAFVTPSRARSSEYIPDTLPDNLLSFFDKINHPFYFIMFQFMWVFSERDIPLFLMF